MNDNQGTDGSERLLLTVRELRELFGVSRSTVYRWVDRGRLRQVTRVAAPRDYQSQRVAIFEVTDHRLIARLRARLSALGSIGASPRFLVDRLALRLDGATSAKWSPTEVAARLRAVVHRFDARPRAAAHKRTERGPVVASLPALVLAWFAAATPLEFAALFLLGTWLGIETARAARSWLTASASRANARV